MAAIKGMFSMRGGVSKNDVDTLLAQHFGQREIPEHVIKRHEEHQRLRENPPVKEPQPFISRIVSPREKP